MGDRQRSVISVVGILNICRQENIKIAGRGRHSDLLGLIAQGDSANVFKFPYFLRIDSAIFVEIAFNELARKYRICIGDRHVSQLNIP